MIVVFMPASAGPKTLGGALAVMIFVFLGMLALVFSMIYASFKGDVTETQRVFHSVSETTKSLLKASPHGADQITTKLLINAGGVPMTNIGERNDVITIPFDGRVEVSATEEVVVLKGTWFAPGMVAKRSCRALMRDEAQNLGKAYHVSGNCDDPRKAELVVRYDRTF